MFYFMILPYFYTIQKPNESEEAQEYASVLANSKYYRHAAPEELNGCGETLHATTV